MARSRAYKLEGHFGKFNGTKVYYLGFKKQPKFLKKGGRGFSGLKHLLELISAKFPKFTLTFTPDQCSAKKIGKKHHVRLSATAVKWLGAQRFDANRDLNLRLGSALLAANLSKFFSSSIWQGRRIYWLVETECLPL